LKRIPNKKAAVCLVILGLVSLMFFSGSFAEENDQAPGRSMADQATKGVEHWSTTDHSKFPALDREFDSGTEITEACLSCHTEAEAQIHKTIHWTWLSPYDVDGTLGKAGYSINNFCVSANKMKDTECTHCHVGWKAKEDGINCLLCHSQKDIKWRDEFADYHFFKEMGDKEIADEIQTKIRDGAKSIGLPGRTNCGNCHFYGGGGEAVKHGDLDASLVNPMKTLDVHMAIDGQNFRCTRCHTTVFHRIAGRVYSTPAVTHRKSLVESDLVPKIMCESCHTATPHKKGHKANDHTDRVACQSCHIPKFARAHATMMWWDWSTAGKLKDGKPYREKGEWDRPTYKSIKGSFKWDKDVTPEYFWYNGSLSTITAKDVIDPTRPVWLSKPAGSRDDPNSRIFPFKVHRGNTPYDKVNNTMLTMLESEEVDGFWKTFDWQDAMQKGMAIMGLPYSGEIGFVKTNYVYPTTHMVAPKENVVDCIECHRGNNSRLASLTGFYMPGRDHFKFLDILGWLGVLAAAGGISLHAAGRYIAGITRRKEK
jgi:octaheme c-type cytochrome (tetrathionate reductase family)